MLAGVPAGGGELQCELQVMANTGIAPVSRRPLPSPLRPSAPPDPSITNVRRLGRGRQARPVMAEGVRLCHATVGGVSPDQTPSATPAGGWRLRPVQFAPPSSIVPFAIILRNGREWKRGARNAQDLGFLLCAARYRPRVGLSASGFGLGLKGTRVYGKMGALGVSCFGGLELGFWKHVFWNVFGGIF